MFALLLLAVIVSIALWGALFLKINRDIAAPRPVVGFSYVTSWDGSQTRVDPFTGRTVTREEDSRYAVDPFVDGFKAFHDANGGEW